MQWKFLTEKQKPLKDRKSGQQHGRLSKAEKLRRICERIKAKRANTFVP